MRQFIAVILFTLFNLGAFGVTIKQHLCCHSEQTDHTSKHCNEDESCCGGEANCCDEIVSQVKIAKDYNANSFKIHLQADAFLAPFKIEIQYSKFASIVKKATTYTALHCNPPPEDFQIAYSSFLI